MEERRGKERKDEQDLRSEIYRSCLLSSSWRKRIHLKQPLVLWPICLIGSKEGEKGKRVSSIRGRKEGSSSTRQKGGRRIGTHCTSLFPEPSCTSLPLRIHQRTRKRRWFPIENERRERRDRDELQRSTNEGTDKGRTSEGKLWKKPRSWL